MLYNSPLNSEALINLLARTFSRSNNTHTHKHTLTESEKDRHTPKS